MDKLKHIFSQKDIFFSIILTSISAFELTRLYFKVNKAEKRRMRMGQDPIPIPVHLKRRLDEFLFARVSFSGKYDHQNEIYLHDKKFNSTDIEFPPYKHDKRGTQVITPFYCNELDDTILVNRGWVPKQLKEPSTREQGQEQGEVALVGIVRATKKTIVRRRAHHPVLNTWSYEDIEAMARVCGTAPILIDSTYESSAQGGPIGGQTYSRVPLDLVDYGTLFGAVAFILWGAIYLKMGFLARVRLWAVFKFQSRKFVAKDIR